MGSMGARGYRRTISARAIFGDGIQWQSGSRRPVGEVVASDLIHDFWFGTHPDDALVAQLQASLWWSKKPCLDQQIRARFAPQVEQARRGELADWTNSAHTSLSLILLTDQFPRSIYRDTPQAFLSDPIAQAVCLAGLEKGFDGLLRPVERVFFYLPLEHAESAELQDRSVQLYTQLCRQVPSYWRPVFQGFLDFAVRHKEIIDRFGRFPHRNRLLGRKSTEAEQHFMRQPGSSF
jgi:uncharacterized protein (DUF924 family)